MQMKRICGLVNGISIPIGSLRCLKEVMTLDIMISFLISVSFVVGTHFEASKLTALVFSMNKWLQ